MQKKNPKTRCERKQLSKCEGICRLYNKIQIGYADRIQEEDGIVSFRCNVPLDGPEAEDYTTDFVCTKADGTLRVRECVWRHQLTWPSVVKLLEISRQYWYVKRGIRDWGIVVDKKKDGESDET